MDTLELIEGKTFPAGTTVEIDGKRFVRCTFDHCQLVYQGTDDLSFEHCTFIQPEWTFEGAAEKVLAFMGDAYEGLGDEGRLVESLFRAVRRGETRDTAIPILTDHELSRLRLAS